MVEIQIIYTFLRYFVTDFVILLFIISTLLTSFIYAIKRPLIRSKQSHINSNMDTILYQNSLEFNNYKYFPLVLCINDIIVTLCYWCRDSYHDLLIANLQMINTNQLKLRILVYTMFFTEIFISNTSQESYANISNISIYKTFQFSYH